MPFGRRPGPLRRGEIIFWFTSGLIEKHLDVSSGGGGLFGPGWAMWADPILSKLALFVSDDASPLNPLADSMVAAGSTVVELQSAGPAADPADVMLRMILGSCDASELQGLDAIRKIGAKTKGVESVALIASELTGPLHLGDSVARFEVLHGMRNVNAAAAPRIFSS